MSVGALRSAAAALRRAGDATSARRVMEFVYTRQLDGEELAPPIFLGLAEIRVQQGNVPAALELLHRLTLVAGEPFDNLADAAPCSSVWVIRRRRSSSAGRGCRQFPGLTPRTLRSLARRSPLPRIAPTPWIVWDGLPSRPGHRTRFASKRRARLLRRAGASAGRRNQSLTGCARRPT